MSAEFGARLTVAGALWGLPGAPACASAIETKTKTKTKTTR